MRNNKKKSNINLIIDIMFHLKSFLLDINDEEKHFTGKNNKYK